MIAPGQPSPHSTGDRHCTLCLGSQLADIPFTPALHVLQTRTTCWWSSRTPLSATRSEQPLYSTPSPIVFTLRYLDRSQVACLADLRPPYYTAVALPIGSLLADLLLDGFQRLTPLIHPRCLALHSLPLTTSPPLHRLSHLPQRSLPHCPRKSSTGPPSPPAPHSPSETAPSSLPPPSITANASQILCRKASDPSTWW